MNATRKELIREFNRAKANGWIAFFDEAVKAHTVGVFDTADLMAIASRETNLDPKWLTKAGDGGHGHGLMQVDVRFDPEWVRSGKWRDPRECVLKGADVLMTKYADVLTSGGKRISVKSSKTGVSTSFIAKKVEGAEAQAVTIASYNAGRWAHYAVSKGRDVDTYTTGRDYSGDVTARAAVFRDLLTNKETPQIRPLVETEQPQTGLQSNDNSAESLAIPDTSFIADAFDKNVSKDQITNASRTAGQKAWAFLIRPIGLIYAALEAGNIAAWLGVVVLILIVGLLLYWHRADIAKLIDKLKGKFTQ